MSELKLLNCPFCNGKAEFVKMGFAKDIPLGFVRCTECGIRLRQGNCTEDFARDEWNRRTPMDNIVEKLEEKQYQAEKDMGLSEDIDEMNGYGGMSIAYETAINIVRQEINNGN